MERLDYRSDPPIWHARPNRFRIALIRPPRLIWQRLHEGVYDVECRGIEHIQQALRQGAGILIVTNHVANPDPFVFLRVADRLRQPFKYLVAWQVFQRESWLGRRFLQVHGSFSVNREQEDARAVRHAVAVLRDQSYPLVMFPEGEIYHTGNHVHPFRVGSAAIALTAARLARRPIVCIPGAIRYRFLDDPSDAFHDLLGRLEQRSGVSRCSDELVSRVHHFARHLLERHERDGVGSVGDGPLATRLGDLAEAILRRLENIRGLPTMADHFTDRVVALRRLIIKDLESDSNSELAQRARQQMDDLLLATRCYSFVPNLADPQPTLERFGEMLDKWEEDVLDAFRVSIRGKRKAIITFGEPIPVSTTAKAKHEAPRLTQLMETRVRSLLQHLVAEMDRDRPRWSWPVADAAQLSALSGT